MNEKIQNIQVLGSGCPTCKKLFELTKQAVLELGIKIEVEYITDINKMVEMGIMSSPAIAINNKTVLAGFLPDLEKIKEIINSETAESASDNKPACSCGGNC